MDSKGLYVGVTFSKDTVERIRQYAEQASIPNLLNAEHLHSTLAYSRNLIDGFESAGTINEIGTPTVFDIWEIKSLLEIKSYCLVLKFNSGYMQKRFNEIISMGATYDYDHYIPHVTFSYDVGKEFRLQSLPPIIQLGVLNIVNEYQEILDLDKYN